jgi:hypothetical protein
MALVSANVLPLVGRQLELQPYSGWGWAPSAPWPEPVDRLPPRLPLRLDGLFRFQGGLKAGFGQILPHGSDVDGFWLLFELRIQGSFDFDQNTLSGVTLAESLSLSYSVLRRV